MVHGKYNVLDELYCLGHLWKTGSATYLLVALSKCFLLFFVLLAPSSHSYNQILRHKIMPITQMTNKFIW